MKKIVAIAAAGIMSLGLVACSGEAEPAPTVTVTEESIQQDFQVGSQNSTQEYLDFVKDKGGLYASFASESDLIALGETICDGFSAGLSQDDVISVVVEALIQSDMADENGTLLGAALISGAKVFLCPASV